MQERKKGQGQAAPDTDRVEWRRKDGAGIENCRESPAEPDFSLLFLPVGGKKWIWKLLVFLGGTTLCLGPHSSSQKTCFSRPLAARVWNRKNKSAKLGLLSVGREMAPSWPLFCVFPCNSSLVLLPYRSKPTTERNMTDVNLCLCEGSLSSNTSRSRDSRVSGCPHRIQDP